MYLSPESRHRTAVTPKVPFYSHSPAPPSGSPWPAPAHFVLSGTFLDVLLGVQMSCGFLWMEGQEGTLGNPPPLSPLWVSPASLQPLLQEVDCRIPWLWVHLVPPKWWFGGRLCPSVRQAHGNRADQGWCGMWLEERALRILGPIPFLPLITAMTPSEWSEACISLFPFVKWR